MRALIIGAAGFVGHHLIHYLRDELCWPVAATKLSGETLDEPDVQVFNLDILQPEQLSDTLKAVQPDCIFHLAAQSSVALSWKKPGLTVDINIKGTLNLLEAVRTLKKRPRVLLIGSGEEYGAIRPEETPVKEGIVLRPGNIYAATKACQNMLGKIYADAYGVDIILIRAFNHMGPGQAPMFVVADFCRQVARIEKGLQEPVLRVGNLSAKRDFTDVRDVVRAYALLAQHGKSGETYNVGSGQAVAISDILERICAFSSADISVKTDESRLRPVDIPVIEADITRLNRDTGWVPQIPFDISIQEVLAYWRDTAEG